MSRHTVYIKNIPLPELKEIIALVDYEKECVVQRDLSWNEALTIQLLAVEKGLGITPCIAPGDALLQILEGKARVVIAGNPKTATAGKTMTLPAGATCELLAEDRFKAILTIIRQPELIGIEPDDE